MAPPSAAFPQATTETSSRVVIVQDGGYIMQLDLHSVSIASVSILVPGLRCISFKK
jgi:hypothetical protein